MSSLQEARARLASHFSNGTADDGTKWAALWDRGDFLPWDRSMPNPALEDVLTDRRDLLGLPLIRDGSDDGTRKQAFVPGCGKGYDVLLLASFGYDAYGLEISESAVKQCLKEQTENGHKYPVRDEGIGAGKATFVQGDFFQSDWLRPDVSTHGKFDLIYDHTVSFPIALPLLWLVQILHPRLMMGRVVSVGLSRKVSTSMGPSYVTVAVGYRSPDLR